MTTTKISEIDDQLLMVKKFYFWQNRLFVG